MTDLSPALLEQFVDLLADALAPRLADELAARRFDAPAAVTRGPLGLAARVRLDELVTELPPAKTPDTWKRWLYEHLRRGEVPGAVKLAGTWFFDVDRVRAWLEAGAPCDARRVVP